MRDRVTFLSFGVAGDWHTGPAAPNGCVPGGRERYLSEVEIYLADYYGRGAKPYAYFRQTLQTAAGSSVLGLSSDGDVNAIIGACEEVGIGRAQFLALWAGALRE